MKKYLIIVCTALISSIAIGQTTWYEIPTGTTKKLNAIDFPSDNVGYIVGEDSTILKTINGGQTWEALGMNGISITSFDDNFTDIDFIDENTGFLVSGYSGTYKTTDGGQTWILVTGQISNMCYPHTVYPLTETDYFIAGGGCFEGAVIDHFANNQWYYANLSLNFWIINETVVEMSFNDLNNGLAATRSEYILKTIDGGFNWDTISTGISGELTSVVMVNDTLCYAGYDQIGAGFGILKSVDGGLTWDEDPSSATFFYPAYLSVHAAQNGDIYSGAVPSNFSGGLIFESTDITNWLYYNVDQPINDMTSYGSDITFGVGDSGYLVVNTPIAELGVKGIDLIEFNVYPNPVLNILTIENPNTEMMEVMILDGSGRILKEELVMSGISTIDCSNLTSGIYFVKVKIGNEFGLMRIVKQ